MKTFKVIFVNGSHDIINGSRVYSNEYSYIIDHTDHPSVVYSCPKSSVKCITPLADKEVIMNEWKEMKGFDVCNKCQSQDVSLLCDDTGYIPNGTKVKCNECSNKGETMAYGNEEVVTEWEEQ